MVLLILQHVGVISAQHLVQVSGALAEGTDAETAALNVEMGSLAVPNSAQHAAETALASLEARRTELRAEALRCLCS